MADFSTILYLQRDKLLQDKFPTFRERLLGSAQTQPHKSSIIVISLKCWVSLFKFTLHEQLNSLLQRPRFSHIAPYCSIAPSSRRSQKKLTALSLNLNSYSLAFYWANLEGTASPTALLNRTKKYNRSMFRYEAWVGSTVLLEM